MKISITPNAEVGSIIKPQPRVLGDDGLREFIEMVPPIEATVEVQTVALPRAPSTTRFLRQNSQVRFSFITNRGHANFAEAMAFAIREIKEVKGIVGTLAISGAGITGGGQETISDCIISAVRVLDVSSSTMIQYAVEGGDFD